MIYLKKLTKKLLDNQFGNIHLLGLIIVCIIFFVAFYITKSPSKVLSQTSDTTPPSTLVQLVNPVFSNIFTCNAQVNIICRDEVGGSGCNSTSPLYCIDQTNTCTPDRSASLGPVLVSQEGLFYIRYQSKDNAGNLEAVKSSEVRIDRSLPSMKLNTNPSTASRNFTYSWTLSGVQDDSGIQKVECYLDGSIIGSPIRTPNYGSGYACTIHIPSTTSVGYHTVTAKVYDNANWYKSDTTTINVQ